MESGTLLNVLNLGVLSVNRARRILWSNNAANRILLNSLVLRGNNGVLDAYQAPHRTVLDRAVERAIAGASADRCAFSLSTEGAHPVSVLVMREGGPLPNRVVPGRALVFMSDPNMDRELNSEILAGLFGLTPAETAVAAALLKVSSPKEIAAELGISVNTVRNHLKRLFAKTDTRNQCEFMFVVLRSPAALALSRRGSMTQTN